MKKINAFFVAVVMLFSVTSCREKQFAEFKIEFLDVGKADSMILTTEKGTVIIDCGEKNDGKDIVSYLEENNIESVDYLIITHYDKDHVGGASKVIKNTDVKNILAPDYQEDSKEVEKYMKSAEEKGITPVLVTEDFSFTVDGVDYTVYAPKKAYNADSDDNDDNYFSLVTKAVYKDNSFIFTGDAIYQRLEEVMDIGDCDLLKIPYHARKIDNLGQFLENTKPEYAVACTSESEFADETKSLLNEYNITYYATCYDGNITATSDGHRIKIKTEK